MSEYNTMVDLRKLVAQKMRAALHGREFDVLEEDISVEEMLGIFDVGAKNTDFSGTLLDPDHEFWDAWYEDVYSIRSAESKIESAIRSLKADGHVDIVEPYGNEADIIYVEVSVPQEQTGGATECPSCKRVATVDRTFTQATFGQLTVRYKLNCPNCGETNIYERPFHRV